MKMVRQSLDVVVAVVFLLAVVCDVVNASNEDQVHSLRGRSVPGKAANASDDNYGTIDCTSGGAGDSKDKCLQVAGCAWSSSDGCRDWDDAHFCRIHAHSKDECENTVVSHGGSHAYDFRCRYGEGSPDVQSWCAGP